MEHNQYIKYLNHKFIECFSISQTKPPEWQCPHCHHGILVLKPDSISYSETPESIKLRAEIDWEPDWLDYRFTAVFSCNSCTGDTFVCGQGKHVYWQSLSLDDEGFEEIVFTPRYFEPAIRLFNIPSSCPDVIVKTLDVAFAVSWIDVAAACSRLRVATEKIVYELDPSLTGTLHDKIQKLQESHPWVHNLLMAIKWLGNDASHDDSLQECDLALGFRIMKTVLDEIYVSDRKEVDEFVGIINSMKGSPLKKDVTL